MRIGVITQWYDPEEGSAVLAGTVVRSLQARGHEVVVLTGFPNYPHGRIYDGYRIRPRVHGTENGTEVTRVALYPSHDRSAVRRAANYLSFAATSATLGIRTLREVDVCLVFCSPATAALPAMVARRLRGTPFLLYIQDLWPDTVVATGMLRRGGMVRTAERWLGRFCAAAYRSSSVVAVISPSMARLLTERGVPAGKIQLVYNWVDEAIFFPPPLPVSPLATEDDFTVMYAGSIGEVQGLDTAIRALAIVDDNPRTVLHLVGTGVAVPSLTALATELGVDDRVVFHGARRVADMPALMAAADVQLVSLRDLPVFHATMPSKVQANLATGCPVIASVPGDAGALVLAAGAGFACTPEDDQALADALRKMRDAGSRGRRAMGAKGREYYRRQMSAEVGAQRLESALRSAAA